FSATALVISNMAGTGIFTSTGFMAGGLGSVPLILAALGVGALFAFARAVSYSPLGVHFPPSRRADVHFNQAYGATLGFMTGWVSFFAGFSAPIAAAALAFADFLGHFFPAFKHDQVFFTIGSGALSINLGAGQIIASVLIAGFTVLNCLGVRRSAVVQN